MTYTETVVAAAKAFKVSSSLLLAICTHESGGLKNVLVPHDHGTPTYGICQVKAGTAEMFGYKNEGTGLMDPATNAKYAALYLRYQLDRYDQDPCMSVAAYNAGSFNESTKVPGKPKNLRYVRLVQEQLPVGERHLLSCELEMAASRNE